MSEFSRGAGVLEDDIYNIEDVDLSPYLQGEDLQKYKEICKTKKNNQTDDYTI